MLAQLRRRLTRVLAIAALAACRPVAESPPPSGARYLVDRAFRRRELEISLVDGSNRYSRLRLARYASGDALDWD